MVLRLVPTMGLEHGSCCGVFVLYLQAAVTKGFVHACLCRVCACHAAKWRMVAFWAIAKGKEQMKKRVSCEAGTCEKEQGLRKMYILTKNLFEINEALISYYNSVYCFIENLD